jgi:hypothetical protein
MEWSPLVLTKEQYRERSGGQAHRVDIDCGQVDKDARTCLESGECGGGCGQVDEGPRARLQSGGVWEG